GEVLFGRTAFGGASWSSENSANSPGGGVIFAVPRGVSPPTACTGAAPSVATYSFTSSTSLPTSGYQPHHDSMTLVGQTLYGTALATGAISMNGTGLGTVFAVDADDFASNPTAAYNAFHNFAGPVSDGAMAHSCFAIDQQGGSTVLYGAT